MYVCVSRSHASAPLSVCAYTHQTGICKVIGVPSSSRGVTQSVMRGDHTPQLSMVEGKGEVIRNL